jgi:hypothetical protein
MENLAQPNLRKAQQKSTEMLVEVWHRENRITGVAAQVPEQPI